MELTPEREAEIVAELKRLPDFVMYPIPQHWYKKYDIAPRKPFNFKEFVESGEWYKSHFNPAVEREIRTEPAPGGVRPVLEIEPVKAETVSGNLLESHETKEDSKESNETERQESLGHSNSPPSQSAELDTETSS